MRVVVVSRLSSRSQPGAYGTGLGSGCECLTTISRVAKKATEARRHESSYRRGVKLHVGPRHVLRSCPAVYRDACTSGRGAVGHWGRGNNSGHSLCSIKFGYPRTPVRSSAIAEHRSTHPRPRKRTRTPRQPAASGRQPWRRSPARARPQCNVLVPTPRQARRQRAIDLQ